MKNILNIINKNTEKQMVRLLTEVCEQHKIITNGFSWLTHTLDTKRSVNSLQVVCIFENQQSLNTVTDNKGIDHLITDILTVMATLNIKISSPKKLLKFAIEENFQGYH